MMEEGKIEKDVIEEGLIEEGVVDEVEEEEEEEMGMMENEVEEGGGRVGATIRLRVKNEIATDFLYEF